MLALFLAALLPAIYWDRGPDAAEMLKKAGVQRIYVPAGQAPAWEQAGFTPVAFNAARVVKVSPPRVQFRMDQASATRQPWIDANGWIFQRGPGRVYYCDAPAGAALTAAAEAFAYGVDEVIRPDPRDVPALGDLLAFLRRIDQPRLPTLANIGVVDDGSDETGEVMNLLARRNLLFRVIQAPDPRYDLSVKLGTAEYPRDEAADPAAFAQRVREKLGDEKRLVRLYGSSVVIARLTGEGGRARLHLINYSRRPVQGLHLRVLGPYTQAHAEVFGVSDAALQDLTHDGRAIEFTVPAMNAYAVVDLH